jgi:hypothetical protein
VRPRPAGWGCWCRGCRGGGAAPAAGAAAFCAALS